MRDKNYISPEYGTSRRRYVREVREMAKAGPPAPEKDWDVVYVFSGPEVTLEQEPDKDGKYNQTEARLKTGFDLARKITALRLAKDSDAVTVQDMREHGPDIHFNGYEAHNQYMRATLEQKRLEKEYSFPDDKFILPPDGHTKHTGQQIEKLPAEFAQVRGKIALVSDLYHLPRIRRYFGAKHDTLAIPQEKLVFYFPTPARMPRLGAPLHEASSIHPYSQKGDLSED